MKRQRLVGLTTIVIGLMLSALAPAAWGDECTDFSNTAILATNSVLIATGTTVDGHVVVNAASPGPTLSAGVELDVDRGATINGVLTADSIDLSRAVTINGDLFYNELIDRGATINGTQTSPLDLPVFDALPAFQQASVRADATDVLVAAGQTVVLTDPDFGDITIEEGGTVVFSGGGIFNVRSITAVVVGGQCPFPCRSVTFDAPTELRVEGRLDTERNSFVGPSSGSGIAASDILIYAGGINGLDGALGSVPPAVGIGRGSTVEANVYAPNGTLLVEQSTTATGAFIGRDVQFDRNSVVGLDSAFVNQAPTADPKTVFTDGNPSVVITLTGSDPESSGLIFAIGTLTDPAAGTLSGISPIQDPGQCSETPQPMGCLVDGDCPGVETCVLPPITAANVTYTPNDPTANLTNSFQYTVEDECQIVSSAATVDINPPGDPTDPPDDPIAAVDATDVTAETTTNTSATITLEASAPGFCSVSPATTCEDLEDGDPETTNSTDCPLNQDGDPETSETCDADPLTFSIESLPNGSLSDPGNGDIETTPFTLSGSAVIYTPPVDFASGICTISGDLCEIDDDCLPDGGTCIPPDSFTFGATGVQGGFDTATVTVSVFTQQELADDQSVSTTLNTPVEVTLTGNPGGAGTGGNAPLTAPTAPPAAPTPAGPASTSSSGLSEAQIPAPGLTAAQKATFRIDFGVTPDDFGNANPCGFISITTQYVETQSIVFGTAVSFPGPVTIPNVVIVNDGAANPPCRSSGEPVFTGDWWAQFRTGTAPGVAGDLAGVNSFSVDVGFINNPGDGIADLIAYDSDGNVIDQAFTTSTGGPFQVLTVNDPNLEKAIAFVHVNSSDDAAGLGMDFLDYDEPASVSADLGLTWTVTSLPPANEGTLTTLDGSLVTQFQTFTAEPTLVFTPALGFSGMTSFTYEVTEGLLTDTATVDILIANTDECVLVGREPGCAPGGGN